MASCRRHAVILAFCVLCGGFLLAGETAAGAEPDGEAASGPQEELAGEYAREFLEDIPLEEIQEVFGELLKGEEFRLTEAVGQILEGELPFSRETVLNIVYRAVYESWDHQRERILQIILLVLAAALFFNFAKAFEKSAVGELGFYVVYLLLFALLVSTFGDMSRRLEEILVTVVTVMKVITPAYYMAVTVSTGISTAALFYDLVLMLILAVQVVVSRFILPCVNLYVLLSLVNHLSKEGALSRLADLMRTLVEWSLHTLLGVLLGLQLIRGLVAPVMDTLRRSALGKTAGALPGIGNAINSVTEILLTGAVLVRNSLGVVFLLAFFLWGVTPLVWYAANALLYKLLAALAQPVSDKRMAGCIATLGEGCVLLMKTLFVVEVLSVMSIVIIAGTR